MFSLLDLEMNDNNDNDSIVTLLQPLRDEWVNNTMK